ncbi:MAG: sugar phosphate isomerase/epimerase [Pirellulales bacterium]|nr:sugar phosphate isomerase/epimerase [Pirellulales bacterium]
MQHSVNRREFLATSAAVAAGAMAVERLQAAAWKTTLQKALIGVPTGATLEGWKAAGFEGIESNDRAASPEKAAAARQAAEKLGMRIHSVLYGWANFNQEKSVERDIAGVRTALQACQAYGADALLLVPCRIGGNELAMPQPWEFDIAFDEKTGHIKRVVAGDNTPYEKYIAAHNHATDTSRKAVQALAPFAEKTGVIIALENVWNNLWVKPAIFQNFIASFDSPWVQCYFDIGNHVRYAPPEEWIRALGKLIVKCHVKDFKLNADGHGGRFVDIRDGSVDWPLIRKELDQLGYNGWMTIEGSGGLSLSERSRRLDLIIAGK